MKGQKTNENQENQNNKNKTMGKKLYIAAAIFSLLLYSSGVLSGLFIEQSMTEYTEVRVKSLQRQVENLQLEYAYLSMIGKDLSCKQLSSLVGETTKKVWKLGKELDEDDPKFEELRRDYALLSTKAWILNSYVRERCGDDVVTLLYFYSVPCEECIEQGRTLDKINEKFGDRVQIFVLNAGLDEPIVNTLKTAHSINQTPAVVIGEKTYFGPMPEENLTNIINNKLDAPKTNPTTTKN